MFLNCGSCEATPESDSLVVCTNLVNKADYLKLVLALKSTMIPSLLTEAYGQKISNSFI